MDELSHLPIEALAPGRFQPRRDFNPAALQELADSITEQGIIEPIIARPIGHKRYEIIAGERRWRAAQLAQLSEVPCIIREYSDEQAAEVTLIENIQREDLNPIEQAEALQRLLAEFQYTHAEIAAAVGQSRAKITNSLRLLQLDQRVQQLLIDKEISAGHGKAIGSVPFAEQYALAQQCVENAWSVRHIEQVVKHRKVTDPQTTPRDPNITRLERVAADRFNAEVKLENNNSNKSGWLKIKYYDYDTLAGILQKMGIECE